MAIEQQQNNITSKKEEKPGKAVSNEKEFEQSLRPTALTDYIGQEKLKRNLHIFLEAAKQRNESIEHILLYGPPGLGKTTLATIIAREMNVNIQTTSGPALEKVGDLGAILTNLQEGDILFIDEVHRLNKLIEEALYPAMEDYKLDIIIGQGPSAKTIQLELPRFTLIGATTKAGTLSKPLRDRFGFIERLEFYKSEHIEKILERSAKILKLSIETGGAKALAKSARQTPRIANRLLKRSRDVAQVQNTATLSEKIAQETLKMLEIDEKGLTGTDRLILKTMITKFNGGPVGLSTIAASIAEEMETIEDVHEPFLLQLGMIERTPRGRKTTETAHNHLNLWPTHQ